MRLDTKKVGAASEPQRPVRFARLEGASETSILGVSDCVSVDPSHAVALVTSIFGSQVLFGRVGA